MKKLSFLLAFLALLVSPSIVFAGGGPVDFQAFPLRPFNDTKTYILQVDVTTDQPCPELKPEVTFQSNINGDSISPFTPPDDGTYFTRHYNTGQPLFVWKPLCTYYFQAKSGTSNQRTVILTVNVDGTNEQRTTTLAYGDDEWSKQLQSFGRMNDYDNTPQVDVISEKTLNEYKREFSLQWQKISWATQYSVFAKQINDDGSIVPIGSFGTTSDTHTTLILPNDTAFYISIMACRKDQDCNTQRTDLYDYLVEKSHTGNTNTARAQEVAKTLPPVVTPSSNPTSDSSKVEALNKKVAELEGKLDKSEKKQNMLEEKINQLLNFLKSLFPSFK